VKDVAIAEARGLAESGKYNEAIEFLTAANRSSRRRELDSMLLALRSEAFLAGDWKREPPAWPNHVPDQFGGTGIPEIRVDALSASAIRSGIENHGSLIVRQLTTSTRAELLRNNIDRVLQAFDAKARGSVPPELEGWYEPFDRNTKDERAKKRSKGAVLTVDSPPALFDLLETFESSGLSKAIRDFFGEQPMLLTRKGTLRCVRHDVNTGGWHQDGAFLGEDIRSLNVWIALTDCGVDAPGLDVVAKRLPGIVQTGSNFATWTTNPQAAKDVSEGCTVRPVFAAGDAILFDHLCLHRTAASPGMTKTRYAIETWIMAPSTYKEMGVPILF
jgi:ectoine hydroxylase-related dioxygenase (phytanoyl-CoA dioxygenase family)